MASKDGETPPDSAQCEKKGKQTGITIDSSLIHTANVGSSDVQDELSVLGVSVYNQQEFEAGVLQQIDKEVQQRNAEQERKFLLKEYNNIKAEINSLRHDLTTISKTMAVLLAQPLSSVGSRLRELRDAQDRKKKQLLTLEARERTALKKLSGKEPSSTSDEVPASSSDVPFGFPVMGVAREGVATTTDEWRLIQTGQMTPFGTSVDTPSADSALSVGEHTSDETSRTPRASAESASSKQPTVQLSSDSFGGLFTNGGLEAPGKRRIARIPKKKKKTEASSEQDHNDTSKSALLEPDTKNGNEPAVVSDSHTTEAAPAEPDDWIPSLTDLLESDSVSNESEYYTDEELGESQEAKKRKKRKRLRPLSDDDFSDESEGGLPRSKRKRAGSRKTTRHGDDGDKNLYRQRLKEEEANISDPSLTDMTFNGGFTIPGAIWHRLYRYQQTGVKWMWELHCQQAGGIMGDEMGLGKTIQIIAFLAGLKISNLRSHVTRKLGLGPVLIVCPATVLHQWVYEFHRWWPPFRVAVLHGSGSHGGSKKRLVQEMVEDNGVLVTTYTGVKLYQDLLLPHKWDYVVLDEGHKIKNPDTEITLACKQMVTPHRIILSGSPIQNNLKELWSLFDFVFPGKLGTLPVFLEQFSVPITMGGYANATEVQVQTAYKCACILRDTINPYMLRRLKADVKIQLPDKNEQVLFCRLTEYQCELYRDYIQSKAVERMLDRGKEVFSGLMALRKLCSHPDLVTSDYCEYRKVEAGKEEEDEGLGVGVGTIVVPKAGRRKKRTGDASSAQDPENEETYGHWRRSGKMVVVDSLLKLWKSQGHKVLIFSQLKAMLDILEIFVRGRGYTYQRMDGTTPISSRQPLVNKFNEDESIFVFLLTTRVGGLGINLTGADRVIIYDPDWNPSTDTQARERAWRIGQTRQVTIYRLLTSGTIEEKIYHRQIFKQFLTNRVLKDPRQRRFFKSNNLHELFTLSSSALEGGTETSAIFSGTNSEIVPRSSKTKAKGRESSGRKLAGKKRKHVDDETDETAKGKSRKKKRKSHHADSVSLELTNEPSTSSASVLTALEEAAEHRQTATEAELDMRPQSPSDELLHKSGVAEEDTSQLPIPAKVSQKEEGEISPKGKTELRELRGRKRKRKKKKCDKPAEVEGERIDGLAYSSVFNPGGEDEERSGKQDDYVLQKLFKKSGVHSALQHDTIMNSADPDYVLVESEANKVAKSAARALKTSRRHCVQMGAGRGNVTWTGQHGSAGALGAPRFGVRSSPKLKTDSVAQTSFNGLSSSQEPSGSLNTSSSVLLAKMRQRNTQATSDGHEAGMGGAIGIHGDTHSELLREIRDFIATQGSVDGQATTAEVLGRFAGSLPGNDAATFKSMLYEICDFSRHRGDGLWSLKPEFR